jgi:hypothetical protein
MKIFLFIGFVAIFVLSEISHAQGFRNPPEGTKALSQAGAFVAQCDDPTAVFHNPAGLLCS